MVLSADAVSAWNAEYGRQGIPSSHREEPSGVLVWALENLKFVSDQPIERVLDVGCGTGRNSVAMAELGFRVTGMDFSTVALSVARGRPEAAAIDFREGNVEDDLPFREASFDFVADIFVYFHQVSDLVRRRYRSEIRRVLAPHGLLLVSMATTDDGYYASCESIQNVSSASSVDVKWDNHAGVANILPSFDQFLNEFSDLFELQMTWSKRKSGLMHGSQYMRETVATMWRVK